MPWHTTVSPAECCVRAAHLSHVLCGDLAEGHRRAHSMAGCPHAQRLQVPRPPCMLHNIPEDAYVLCVPTKKECMGRIISCYILIMCRWCGLTGRKVCGLL